MRVPNHIATEFSFEDVFSTVERLGVNAGSLAALEQLAGGCSIYYQDQKDPLSIICEQSSGKKSVVRSAIGDLD